MTQTRRLPWAAGRFYPAHPQKLDSVVKDLIPKNANPTPAKGILVPHAGYVYSGQTAGKVFGSICVPKRVIILCPNHTGVGPAISVMNEGVYEVPGQAVVIDTPLANSILNHVPNVQIDTSAHQQEHAIEVELPFLLARQPELRIVPIILGSLTMTEAIELGDALYAATQECTGDVLVVASSDMSHFLPEEQTRVLDELALKPLLSLDPQSLFRIVVENNITMCGYIPTVAMLAYANHFTNASPKLIDYTTSGAAFGDYQRVVGYAGVAVSTS